MIIGISGKKQSGKNTVARIWQLLDIWYNKYEEEAIFYVKHDKVKSYVDYIKHNTANPHCSSWKEMSYASTLKQIISLITGCRIKDLEKEEFKNSFLSSEWKLDDSNLTYREALQIIGTNLFRDKFHRNVWVNVLMNKYKPILYHDSGEFYDKGEYPNWLITDVRFPNEASAIIEKGGFIIKVNRLTTKKDLHESETALDNFSECKYIINNNGSLEDLISQVRDIMIKEKYIPNNV